MTEAYPSSNLRQKHVRQLMKTEFCKFFLNNRCGKGSRCAFAHSLTEIREKPNLNCTSMCKSFLQTGNCSNPRCTFAHDERDLRTTAGFFKTKLCRFAASGRCKHGTSCRFAHHPEELTLGPLGLPPADSGAVPGAAMSTAPYSNGMAMAMGGLAPQEQFAEPRLQQQLQPGRFIQAPAQAQAHRPMGTYSYNGDWADITSDQSVRDIASDQSTRADTSASVPTPEGSGDSGQEEFGAPGGYQQRRATGMDGRRARGGERQPGRHCTTMMLTNVPNFLTQGALVSLLEDLTVCMRGAFDFFYCPWDPYQDRNLGYAIINFFSRSVAAEFERQWVNQPLLPRTHGTKRLRIVPAALQGRAANLRHFSGFSLAHHQDPRFRPLVRPNPDEPLRPMALSEELVGSAQRHCQQPNNMVQPKDAPGAAAAALMEGWPHAAFGGGGLGLGLGPCPDLGPAAADSPGAALAAAGLRGEQQPRADMLLSLLAGTAPQEEVMLEAKHVARGMPQSPMQRQMSGGSATGAWPGNMGGGSCPFVLLQPGAEGQGWMGGMQHQQGDRAVGGPEAASGPDEVPMRQCWALVLPQGAGGQGPTDGQGSPSGMGGVGPIPYYTSPMASGMPYAHGPGMLHQEGVHGLPDGAPYSD